MLLELSVIPLGRGRSISADVADMIKIIEASHLEGAWDELMAVA